MVELGPSVEEQGAQVKVDRLEEEREDREEVAECTASTDRAQERPRIEEAKVVYCHPISSQLRLIALQEVLLSSV